MSPARASGRVIALSRVAQADEGERQRGKPGEQRHGGKIGHRFVSPVVPESVPAGRQWRRWALGFESDWGCGA